MTVEPLGALPEAPQYPSAMKWEYVSDTNLWTLDDKGFRYLVQWRLAVEGYFEDIRILWGE